MVLGDCGCDSNLSESRNSETSLILCILYVRSSAPNGRLLIVLVAHCVC